jgi:predicted ATPase
MSGFQHLKVDGFRRLCGVDCELRPLTVMIGANGSGKTSVLEVMSLLAASAEGRLTDKLSELGGIAAVLNVWALTDVVQGVIRHLPVRSVDLTERHRVLDR